MNEAQESITRKQALLMISKNQGKEYIIKRILGRFIKCIGIRARLPFHTNLFKNNKT